jgi:hypothetical protein
MNMDYSSQRATTEEAKPAFEFGAGPALDNRSADDGIAKSRNQRPAPGGELAEKRVQPSVAVSRPRAVFSKEWSVLPGGHLSAVKHQSPQAQVRLATAKEEVHQT